MTRSESHAGGNGPSGRDKPASPSSGGAESSSKRPQPDANGPEAKPAGKHAAGGPPPPPAEAKAEASADLAAQLAAARSEAAHAHDRFLRAVADLENYRRRAVREKEELRLGAGARIAEDLLPVLDTLSLGLDAARQPNADLKGLAGGVELVQQQLKAVLAGHGLVEVEAAGRPFNPHEHQAISHQPSSKIAAEHVLAVVRAGFKLNGRLLRPASVVVSSGAPAAADTLAKAEAPEGLPPGGKKS